MIVAVTGAPGSGKSYYCTRKIADSLDAGKLVATNVTLVPDWQERLARRNAIRHLIPGRIKRRAEQYEKNSYYTDSLAELMRVRLAGEGEGRGVAIIDEAHEWLNNRTWDSADRGEFVRWFSLHRKLGWDTYLITQHLDSIDKQVRDRVEFHVVLRNIKNMKFAGIPIMPVNAFLAIWIWLGGPKTKRHVAKRELFFLDGRRKLYDTMGLHGIDDSDENTIWLPKLDLQLLGPVEEAGASAQRRPADSPVQDQENLA